MIIFFGKNNSEEYKVKTILDSAVYIKKTRVKSSIRAPLFGFMEKIPKRRKYLRVRFSNLVPEKIDQFIL